MSRKIWEVQTVQYNPLLESFPDNAVRMSIEKFDSSGAVSYGPAGVGVKGETYRVTVDYVNSDTTNMRVWIAKLAKKNNSLEGKEENVDLLAPLDKTYDLSSVRFKVLSEEPIMSPDDKIEYEEFNIPVYVGIGLRVTANLEIIGTKVNISGLGVIGAEAEINGLKGNLIVQTLGINGNSVAAALPIQSELNRTTAANAIVSVGSIKALLYDGKTLIAPRVVGMYLPFPGGKPLVNSIISVISKKGVEWKRPCPEPKKPSESPPPQTPPAGPPVT